MAKKVLFLLSSINVSCRRCAVHSSIRYVMAQALRLLLQFLQYVIGQSVSLNGCDVDSLKSFIVVVKCVLFVNDIFIIFSVYIL